MIPQASLGRRIGITTTVPVEVIFAAGLYPIDLNNSFIGADQPAVLVEEAESIGFPRNCCAWVKGIYAACRRNNIRRVVGVLRGDCSNTLALLDILESDGVATVEFAYPSERRPDCVRLAITEFAERLGTTLEAAEECRKALEPIRDLLVEVDRLAWQTGQVTAEEAHEWLISSSDFRGNPDDFGRALRAFLEDARRRPLPSPGLPLALAGVPPIKTDLIAQLTAAGVRIVYDEMPNAFSMISERFSCLENMYCNYIYPYNLEYRLMRLQMEVRRRAAAGVIHYVQSFCYRHIQDGLLRKNLPVPVLTLECDRPGALDAGAITRIGAFVESLRAQEAG
jgi:benzoyl-CoA reductase/2-hydroxyglutaryl-CoA dehydratase subunit BcrC/BadD/HgdB